MFRLHPPLPTRVYRGWLLSLNGSGRAIYVVMDIELLSSIFFGLIVGAAAKLIMPGKDPGGIFVTILLGIAGAVLGGWVKTRLDYGPQEQAAGWIMSILGAVVILALYRVYLAKRSGTAS